MRSRVSASECPNSARERRIPNSKPFLARAREQVRLCLQGGARQHIGYYLDEEAGACAYVQALTDAKARGLSIKNDGFH